MYLHSTKETCNMRALALIFALSWAGLSTAQSFNSIESVEYDPVNQQWLVSNANSIVAQDFQGNLNFFFDAECDYGMEVMGDTLYAINTPFSGNEIRAYNLNDGTLIATIDLPGTQFPNGMASNGTDRLWVTDFQGGDILEIDVTDATNASVSTVASFGVTPNGITYDGDNNRLVYVTWWGSAGIYTCDLADYSTSLLTSTTLGNIDGIDHDGNGNFYIASWNPAQIRKYNEDFSDSEIISAPGLSSPADICYAQEVDTLAVPNSGNNTLTLIGFGTTSVQENAVDRAPMSVYPNPLQDFSVLEFSLSTPAEVQVVVLDLQGKQVWSAALEQHPAGTHRMLFTGIELPQGLYTCRLTADAQLVGAVPVVVK